MRTLFVMNSLGTTLPTAKGDTTIINPDGTISDGVAIPTGALATAKNAEIGVINALGNGSTKFFGINPFNFTFRGEQSGAANSIVPKYTITYPTNTNQMTDSFGVQFQGGIVVKVFDKDINVFKTKVIKTVEVIGAGGIVLVADVKAAFKTAMETLVGTYIASPSVHVAQTSSTYNLIDTNTHIELTGDLRNWNLVKTEGLSLAITGVDVRKFERELAANSGFHYTENETELYAASNFISDTSINYSFITIETATIAQRPLVLGSGGFTKTLHIAIPATNTTLYTKIMDYLNAVQEGEVVTFQP